MNNSLIIGILSWFFPGAGYFLIGRVQRGLIVGGVIWLFFIVAIVSGGAFYPGYTYKEGPLLYLLHIFATLGNGLGYIVNYILGMNPPKDAAASPIFEYAGRFLEVAGLLNFLAIIDVFDLRAGRKQ